MRAPLVALCMILALGVYGASAQQDPAAQVIISEVELNPPGTDIRKEWVEIYNPTGMQVPIGGWTITSGSGSIPGSDSRTLHIPQGTVMEAGEYQSYSYHFAWLDDVSESVTLTDDNGAVIYSTPRLSDDTDDASSWQRMGDDYGWVFDVSSRDKPNVRSADIDGIIITAGTDKREYIFGDVVVISGDISRTHADAELFPAAITINVTGPGYNQVIIKYPDLFLEYSASMNLHRVLGFTEGTYNVSVTYAGVMETTQFSLGDMNVHVDAPVITALEIRTDGQSYFPGDIITITADTTMAIPLEGLHLTVTDPGGVVVFDGTVFMQGPQDGPGGAFATTMTIDSISPAYGMYNITGIYDTQEAVAYFTLERDANHTESFLRTEMQIYEPGEDVVIYGRLTQHTHVLDLDVVRAANLDIDDVYIGTGMRVRDTIMVSGDSTFRYEMPIPDNFVHFGKYRAAVSGNVDTLVTTFDVVEDRDGHTVSDGPLYITTDKQEYSLQDDIRISGSVAEPAVQGAPQIVSIIITDHAGAMVSFNGLPEAIDERTYDGKDVSLSLTAIPDVAGRFHADAVISRLIFEPGMYTIRAAYQSVTAETTFEVVEDAKLGGGTIRASTDRQVYGLGQTVHLEGTFGAQVGGVQGVAITVHKPDGVTERHSTSIQDNVFSWSWDTPRFESTYSTSDRTVSKTNLGTYRLNIATGDTSLDLFFMVSAEPGTENVEPVTVNLDKDNYVLGDTLRVTGQVAEKPQSGRILVPHQIGIKVFNEDAPSDPIYEANVYPSQGGRYMISFELPITVFVHGSYAVQATYNDIKAIAPFTVSDSPMFDDGVQAELLLEADAQVYQPGQEVVLDGRPNKVIHVEGYDVSVSMITDHAVDCGPYYCGKHLGDITRLNPDQYSGFSYTYKIPANAEPGRYEIVVDGGFDTKWFPFTVAPHTIIERSNVITAPSAGILVKEVINDTPVTASKISGSMLVSPGSQAPYVNLQVRAPDGACIIGQLQECIISEKTLDDTMSVEILGVPYHVTYSGTDVSFEGFSIVAESGSGLPVGLFMIDITKEDQSTRFHYKITYEE